MVNKSEVQAIDNRSGMVNKSEVQAIDTKSESVHTIEVKAAVCATICGVDSSREVHSTSAAPAGILVKICFLACMRIYLKESRADLPLWN